MSIDYFSGNHPKSLLFRYINIWGISNTITEQKHWGIVNKPIEKVTIQGLNLSIHLSVYDK